MQNSLNQVKLPTLNGKALRLRKSHQKAGVGKYRCSDFLASMSLLAEGENWSSDSSRSPIVVVTDLKTGAFKGRVVCSLRSRLPYTPFLLPNL